MLESTLRDLRSRCDVARARKPFSGRVMVESTQLHELLVVFEAAFEVGKDSTDARFERLMEVIPTQKRKEAASP